MQSNRYLLCIYLFKHQRNPFPLAAYCYCWKCWPTFFLLIKKRWENKKTLKNAFFYFKIKKRKKNFFLHLWSKPLSTRTPLWPAGGVYSDERSPDLLGDKGYWKKGKSGGDRIKGKRREREEGPGFAPQIYNARSFNDTYKFLPFPGYTLSLLTHLRLDSRIAGTWKCLLLMPAGAHDAQLLSL